MRIGWLYYSAVAGLLDFGHGLECMETNFGKGMGSNIFGVTMDAADLDRFLNMFHRFL